MTAYLRQAGEPRALAGYRHELVEYPSRLAGHLRAVVWAFVVAGVVVLGLGL